ncbi:MAG: restriction endonuclease subunit S [Spirochaetia bacterium]|nr:restriction endonuclease subunit S [Spirochaetia bacterium]
MSEWKKVKIGDICRIVKGTTGIASAEPGQYPLVVTAEERKTCSTYQFDCEAVCIPLVSSSGHGKKSLKNVHYQSGKFALGTILCAVIPNNPQELDARYLHQYLQFYKDIILVPLMKGAANVSLSMKDIATVEFPLPPIERQRELSNLFVSLQEKQKELSAEYEKQTEYAKLLRQNILQQAIEGKLTADWRKQNPVQKGNPDYDAEALFEQIQKEKSQYKSEKLQEPLFFESLNIPQEWKYPTLFEITKQITDGTHLTPNYVNDGEFFLSAQNVKPFKFIPQIHKFVSKKDFDIYRNNRTPKRNDILMARVGAGIGEAAVIDTDLQFAFYVSLCLIKTFSNYCDVNYLCLVLNSSYGTKYAKNNISSNGSSAGNYNLGHIRSLKIPLPPLAEQKEIVKQVEKHLQTDSYLENQITEREQLTKQLMQSILKDAFEGELKNE